MSGPEIQQTVDHFVNEIAQHVTTVAPKAWAILVSVKRVDCIGQLVMNGIGFIVASLLLYILIKVCSWASQKALKAACDEDGPWIAASIFTGCGAFGAGMWVLVSFVNLMDRWIWIGAFAPDLAVAHDIIMKALGK